MVMSINSDGDGEAAPLDGLSIHTLSLNQDGNLEVQFDLPVEQTTTQYHRQLRGIRTFSVYDDKELQQACKRLFDLVRTRVQRPDPERVKIHCDRCSTSACCRKYNVLVTDHDIERLAARFRMSPAAFQARFTAAAVDWSADFRAQLACDNDAEGAEKCVFLKPDSSGRYRCSVYEDRPKICRDFDMKVCDDFVQMESFVPIESLVRRN